VTDKELTIILPCAGDGRRLGLNTPKELFEIFPGIRLIDFSLKHILAAPQKEKIIIAVVVRPWKTEVVEYVSKQLPSIPVETVIFNDNYQEWPGSVYSAKDLFSKKNLVLLPDSFLSLSAHANLENLSINHSNGKTLVELVEDALSRWKVVFGCIKSTDVKILETLGAVRMENGIVTVFQDKPHPNESPGQFNGYWGCYAFEKEMGKPLYDFLIHSLLHQPLPLEAQSFYPPGVIPIGEYYDLGTWENIECFKREMGQRDSNPLPAAPSHLHPIFLIP
jgi:2-C-methyl-D-erythritol 4-phosphate cytidylyltransferase